MTFQDINDYRSKGRSNLDIATDISRLDPEFGKRWDSVSKMNVPAWKKEVIAREGLNKWYGGNTQNVDDTSNTVSNASSTITQEGKYKNPSWISNIWNGIYTSATAPGEVMQGLADVAGNALAQPVRLVMGKTEPAKGLFFDPNTPQIQNLRQNTINTLDSASLYGGIVGAPFGATALGSALGQGIGEIGKNIMGENPNTALQQVGNVALAGAFGKIAGTGQGGIYQTGARMAAGQAVTEAGKTILGNNPNIVYKNNGDIDYMQTAKNMASSVGQSAVTGMAVHGVAGIVGPTMAGATQSGIKGGVKGFIQGSENIYRELSKPSSVFDTFSSQQYSGKPIDTDAMKAKEYKDTIAKIAQETDPKMIESMAKGLDEINTKGVRTYEDLQNAANNTIRPLMDLAEEIRMKYPTPKPLNDLVIKYKEGSKSISINPVDNAINHLQELYSQNGDYKGYVKLQNFKEKANTIGLSPSEVNALAVEYGRQKRGFSDATGRPLTSVNGQLYEATRSQLKQVSRDMVPDKTLAIIDQKVHNIIDLKSNVEDIVAKVQQLKNKVETRGLLERASRLTMKLIDAATFHSLRGAAQAIFPSNVGTKQMNYLQIEEALTNNLKKFEKLSKDVQKMNDVKAAQAINKYVTENITAPQYRMQKEAIDQYLGVDSSTLTPEELIIKINQKQSSQPLSQSQSEETGQGANTSPTTLSQQSAPVNTNQAPGMGKGLTGAPEETMPLSSFSPQGVADAQASKALRSQTGDPNAMVNSGVPTISPALKKKFPNLTPEEIASLTPEEKSLGAVGGSDSVGGGGMTDIGREIMAEDARVAANVSVAKSKGQTVLSDIQDEMLPGIKGKMVESLRSEGVNGKVRSVLSDGRIVIEHNRAPDGGTLRKSAEYQIYPQDRGEWAIVDKSPFPLPKPLGGSDTLEPLMKEARKYKSAEEFVKNVDKGISNAETGKPIVAKLYHGSPDARFAEEFNPTKKGYYPDAPDMLPDNSEFISLHGGVSQGFTDKSVTGNIGVSFTDSYKTAKSYANKPAFDYMNSVPMVLERHVKLENPKVFDLKGKEWNLQLENEMRKAINEGHDGLIFKNILDNYHPFESKTPSNNIIVFDKKNIFRKEQLTDLWKKANSQVDTLAPLMKEAKKYKSAEEFASASSKVFSDVRKYSGGDHNVFVKNVGKDGISLHQKLMDYLSSPEVAKLYDKGLKDTQILKDLWKKANSK